MTPGKHEAWWKSPTAVAAARVLRGRFTGLTIVLLTLLFLADALVQQELREAVVALALVTLLLFAIWSVGPRLRIATAMLALPTVVGQGILRATDSAAVHSGVFALTTLFLAYLTLVIIFAVFRDQAVTADTLVGAICAYLLLGLTWGTAYALVVAVSPNAFAISPALASATEWGPAARSFNPLLQYYSFVTLSTLGYGDMSPLSAGARTLSVLEGLTGQLYLAILIARLVGLHAARSGQP